MAGAGPDIPLLLPEPEPEPDITTGEFFQTNLQFKYFLRLLLAMNLCVKAK